MNIADKLGPRSLLQVPAPWLAASTRDARAFDTIGEALAAIDETLPKPPGGGANVAKERCNLDALAAA